MIVIAMRHHQESTWFETKGRNICTSKTFECQTGTCTTRRCVMCNVDDDCGCNAPICNTRQGRCVKCKGNDDCDRGVCDIRQGRCVQCNVDDDCDRDRGHVCNYKNMCSRCERGYYNPNRGRCEECNVDNDCKASGPKGVRFCNTDWNIC